MLNILMKNLENPDRPFLGPIYRVLKMIGFILPENRILKILYLSLHNIVTIFVFTQFMELYVIRSDRDLVLTNLKISLLSIVCIAKINTFVFWQAHWMEVIQYVTEADKYERDTRDDIKGTIIDSYTKYCRKIIYFYWILVFTTFITVISTPLMRYMSSKNYREAIKAGVELFPHIFSSWMPFDKYTTPGCWITVLWHVLLSAYGAGIMAGYDTSVVVIMVFFGGKLELLRERCKQMFGNNGLGISDEEARSVVRQLHTAHVLLMKYSKLFNSINSPVMFVYIVICSMMLCASVYQLITAQDATQSFLMTQYLIFGVAQIFMFCWHSNDVLVKNTNVMLGPYESQWLSSSLRQRKSLLLLVGQMRLVHTYTAGPFTKLTLSAFITVVRAAYSYYTLLRK